MLNKFLKTIHNKYSRFFKFIFFLRYLFAIFFVSISLFLTTPIFFNYEEKEDLIKNYFIKEYNFRIGEYDNIKYKAFPVPRLELKKARINFIKSNINLNVSNLKIYPKILSIYNLNHFEVNKIILKESITNLEITNFPIFIKQVLSQKKKIYFNNLNLKIMNNNKLLLKLDNITFANFGYQKNIIKGKIFEKKFKAELSDKLKSIKFKILNSGISVSLDLDEKKRTGIFKSKILNSNLKFNFKYDNENLKILNSYFRSKNLSFNHKSLITFIPFHNVNTNLEIEEINLDIFERINLYKLLEFKHIIKKINSQNLITYKPKNFSKSFIDDFNLQINLAYGRLDLKKKFSLTKNFFECKSNLNLLEEFPVIYFDCFILVNNKKDLFKKFSIKTKSNKDILRIKAKGDLNLLNKKINYEKILLNEKISSKEDLNYYKESFENIFFDKSFSEIFVLKKIKSFILEII